MRSCTAVFTLVAVAACGGKSTPAPAAGAPPATAESGAALDAMPDTGMIRIALAQNYAVYQMAMVNGDARMLGTMTDADAVVVPPGERPLRGRDSVAVGLVDAALRNAVTAVERSSSGFRVDGRVVHDSGSYLLTRKRADLGTEERGRYWATWRHVGGLDWVLVRDSMVARRP